MVTVGDRRIGPGEPCFVIAEGGVNHNGDPVLARRLIDAAREAGADAVKFQTFDPSALASDDAPKAAYQAERQGPGTQREMLERLVLSHETHVELKAYAERSGLLFLSTPFDEGSADFLESLGVAAFKLPSGELTNHPFLAHVARKRRPILLSTGMANLDEVRAAVGAIRGAADVPIALLHCVSCYPARAEDSNLRAMDTLRREFGVPVGWSDHTLGIHMAVAAAALGANLIEKHITLDRTMPGPDHAASLEPYELRELVRAVRAVSAGLGDGRKVPVPAEVPIAAVARKSLHWSRPLRAGELVRADHLIALRPGTGISPAHMNTVVGRRVRADVLARTMVRETDLEG